MAYSKNRNNPKYPKLLFIIPLIVVATLLLYFATNRLIFKTSKSDVSTPQSSTNSDYINYDPPTESEISSGDDVKEQITDNPDNSLPENSASVVIVDANQYENEIEVRAFVSNVIQNGTCEVTFTKNSNTLSKTVSAYSDASTTPCLNLIVPRNEFPEDGVWNVTVTYTSDSITGSSSTTMELK